MTLEEAKAIVEQAARILGEHFDSFQIMTTWNEESQTRRRFDGGGNWYARQGMAHEFINQDIAQENASQIADKLQPPPDDSEMWKKE